MKRRQFLETATLAGVIALSKPSALLATSRTATPSPKDFELEELTFADLQSGMQTGKWTSRSLVRKYLDRIADIDKDGPQLNSIIELNPDALAIAEASTANGKKRGYAGRFTESRF